jgi:hypothetical protein
MAVFNDDLFAKAPETGPAAIVACSRCGIVIRRPVGFGPDDFPAGSVDLPRLPQTLAPPTA